MNTLNGLSISGTETHNPLTHEVSATPSLKFIREVAEFLEIEGEFGIFNKCESQHTYPFDATTSIHETDEHKH